MGLVLMLLVLPSTSASATPPPYSAEGMDIQGVSAFRGLLGAIDLDGLSTDTNTSGGNRLEIQAPSGFRVERHFREYPIHTMFVRDSPVGGPLESGEAQMDPIDSQAPSMIRTTAYRPSGYNIFIAPWEGHDAPTVEVQSKDSMQLRLGRRDSVQEQDFFVRDSPLIQADVRENQELTDLTGGRDILVSGSFVAVFWEWDLYLDAADVEEADRHVASGLNETPLHPLPKGTESAAGSATYRQVRVFVAGGTLRLDVDPAWNAFYLRAHEIGVEGLLTLKSAIPLDDEIGTLPKDEGFQGSFRANLEPYGADRIAVRFIPTTQLDDSARQGGSPIESIQLDPSPTAAPADSAIATDPGEGVPSLTIGLSVLAVALVLLAAARAVANRRRYNDLVGLMEAQDYAAVTDRSGPLLPTRRYGPRASIMHAVALLKTGQPSRASTFLAALPAGRRPPSSTMAYLQACAEILLGRRDEAARLLNDCLRMDPSYAVEASLNAWFSPLANHPLLATWLGGADPEASYA